jgi:hypothetical protein
MNDDMRSDGSWDYRRRDLELQARLGEISTKLEIIEEALSTEANRSTEGFEELQRLRAEAKMVGIKGANRMSAALIREAMERLRVDAQAEAE